jgi:hypothetical protein
MTLLLMLLLGLGLPLDDEMHCFGPLAPKLHAVELAAVVQAATTKSGPPWAAYAVGAHDNYYVKAFLPPATATARIRRGTAQVYQCHGPENPCVVWKPSGPPEHYAQISAKAAFASQPAVRSLAERPVTVQGSFSDDELFTLVTFLRTKPQLPKPLKGEVSLDGVTDEYPIMSIKRLENVVEVFMSDDGFKGDQVTCKRNGRGWQLVDVMGFVIVW